LVGLTLATLAGNRAAWWAAAGVACAASLMIKPVVPGAVFALLWLIGAQPREQWVRLGGALLLGVGLPCLAIVVVSDPIPFMRHAVEVHDAIRKAHPWDLATNLEMIWGEMLWPLLGMCLLSVLGFGLARRERLTQALGIWGAAAMAAILWHSPLHSQHLVSLLPVLAVLTAGTVPVFRAGGANKPVAATVAVLLVVAFAQFPAALRDVVPTYDPTYGWDKGKVNVARFLAEHTAEGQYVVIDYPMIAFRAGRSVVPVLSDSSEARILGGWLDAEMAIEATRAAKPPLIVVWGDRLEMMPAYHEWVLANYVFVRHFGPNHPVYGLPQSASQKSD
jgi:hypothetical protein